MVLEKFVSITKILVIEDEEALREGTIEILNLEGFQVISADNGRDGVELARQHRPNLVVCDVTMPEMDGYEVITQLRQDPATATIPFIFLTAKAGKTDFRQGMKLGADDYLTKPFSATELLEAIASQFRKQSAVEHKIQQELDNLRSNISLSLPHELHTPLTGIIGIADLLIDDFDGLEPSEMIEMLATIRTSAERLYRLTQNFLLYAELELTATNPNRVAVLRQAQFRTNATPILTELSLQAAAKLGRTKDLRLELRDGIVCISELKLKKIVEEIIDNAFKFSAPKTPVRITSRIHENSFNLYVVNHGRGMTPAQTAHIGAYMQFERKLYEQQGSGLGLIIAKRLVELHGGTLLIESVPNQQTIVHIVLPACHP